LNINDQAMIRKVGSGQRLPSNDSFESISSGRFISVKYLLCERHCNSLSGGKCCRSKVVQK
ncbi:hypothetical protein WKW50_21470, partial [Ochrobactrum sp. GPK 3]